MLFVYEVDELFYDGKAEVMESLLQTCPSSGKEELILFPCLSAAVDTNAFSL